MSTCKSFDQNQILTRAQSKLRSDAYLSLDWARTSSRTRPNSVQTQNRSDLNTDLSRWDTLMLQTGFPKSKDQNSPINRKQNPRTQIQLHRRRTRRGSWIGDPSVP